MSSTLFKVIKEAKDCQICAENLPFGTRPVFQCHQDSKILIAGQAPGKKVHETGIPFNDPSGKRLREWMDVDKETFYNSKKIAILPMGFCYPGTGKSGDLPPRTECAENWRERFLQNMPNIQLILVIGKYAIDYHLGSKQKITLTETVKNWKEYWPELLPLPHPSPRNNIWLRKNPWFEKEVIPKMSEKIAEIISESKA